jgi:hypothetical protein
MELQIPYVIQFTENMERIYLTLIDRNMENILKYQHTRKTRDLWNDEYMVFHNFCNQYQYLIISTFNIIYFMHGDCN